MKAPVTTPRKSPRSISLARRWKARIIKLLRAGLKDMVDPKLTPARRVQQTRRATKAGRALLRLAPAALQRRARGARLALGTARRTLGGARDVDALIENFEKLCPKDVRPKPKVAQILRPLEIRQQSIPTGAETTLAQARVIIQRVLRQLEKWTLPRAVDGEILAAIAKSYRRTRRRRPDNFQEAELEALHDFRTSVVDFRHQAEFLSAHGYAGFGATAAAFKTLHEHIGDHRDLTLLDAYLKDLDRPKNSGFLDDIEHRLAKRQKRCRKAAEKLARKLLNQKPKAFAKDLSPREGHS